MRFAETIFVGTDELGNIYQDLEELEGLKDEFESLDIEGLKEIVSEEGELYNLATFDGHDKFNEIMQSKYANLVIDDMTEY